VKSDTVPPDTVPPIEAVMIVVATFGIWLFAGAASFILLGNGPALIIEELLVMVVPFGYLLARKINVRSYIGAGIKPKTLLLGLAVGALLIIFDIFVVNLLFAILGTSQAIEEENKIIADLISSPPGLLSVLIAMTLAGVCEEFTFRGFLLNAIDRKYSFGPALLVSSLAFAFFHLDFQFVNTIFAFLMGLMLGYVYHRWHSYTLCAVAHATIDLVAVAMTLLIR
jgi:membrane protease YdiL (CAAX protease family)